MPAVVAERQIAKRNHSISSEEDGRYKTQRTETSKGAASCASMDLVCDVEPQRDQLGHVEHQLHAKDEQIHVLQRKLEHFRSWLSGLQGQLAAKDPQLLKNARRLYVGGIPDGTKEEELRAFFEDVMQRTTATCAPGNSITSCKISSDKTYAFLEMRSVEEASNAMAFDGIVFKDIHLKIRRPSNYNAADALALGPSTPDPTVDTKLLPICKTVVEDSWDKIFVGGLPCNYAEEQVKELLQPFGSLKSFNLVMDKATGKSKGYAFCEFNDPRVIPAVINGLHMQCLERKVLTVKRALEGNRQGGGSKTLAPPLGTPAATGPAGGSSSGRLAAAPSGSSISSSSSTALGFSGQQQQGYGGPPRARGPAAAAAAAASGRPMLPPHGDRHSPAAAAAPGSSRGGDQGGFGGFYMAPESNSYDVKGNSYDVTGFGAGFGPGMPPMGPAGPNAGYSGSGSNRGFGSSGGSGGPGYSTRGGPVGFSGRGPAEPHDVPPPPAGYNQHPPPYHHGMGHGSSGSSNWNGMFGPQNPRGGYPGQPAGLSGGPVGHKGSGHGVYPNPRVDIPGVPPYNTQKQYSNGMTNSPHGMTNPGTPSPHTPTLPGAAAPGQLLALNCQPDASTGPVARSGSFGSSTNPTAAAASPVAAITASTRLFPGIGGGAATAAAALAGSPMRHHLDPMTQHRVPRTSSASGDQAVHHSGTVVLPGSDPAAAAAAAVSSISSSGSLYHHDSMSADTAAAAAKVAAAAAPAGEESGDGSSTAAAAAADVLDG